MNLPRGVEMKGALEADKKSPLICYAIRRLNPEIFSHPVWLRFGGKNTSITSEAIQELHRNAEKLQADNAGDACQILLFCSALQSYAGHLDNALRTVQQALALAERNHLSKEIMWAAWGACAICYQAANYDQTVRYLAYLQNKLNDQHDWMLADFVEVLEQDLINLELAKKDQSDFLGTEQLENGLEELALIWLQHWGDSALLSESIFNVGGDQGVKNIYLLNNLSDLVTSNLSKQKYWKSFLNGLRSLLRLRTAGPQNGVDYSRLPKVAISPSPMGTSNNGYPLNDPQLVIQENKSADCTTPVSTVVQMLGSFTMTIQDLPVKVPASRGLSLLKYLLLHHKQDTPRDVLMDIFWPNSGVEAARNNLNVAMHNLRQALHSATDKAVICFEDGAYGLATNLEIWLDVEEFEHCVKEGRQFEARNQLAAAVTEYEIAVNLYRGDFLSDNPYENWTILDRERLRVSYLDTLDHLSQIYFNQESYTACINICDLILARDICREDVHCRMMQCYSRLGQAPLALRQYQVCVNALQSELDVTPAPSTINLYQKIRQHQRV